MSRPGYFLLDSQIGKQSELLVASNRLKEHLDAISKHRQPTIDDIYTKNNLFVTSEFKPHVKIGHEYIGVRPAGAENFRLTNSSSRPTIRFNITEINGDFMHDAVVRLVIKGFGQGGSDWPRFRYCDLPGIRIFRRVLFEVDKNHIDSYTTEDMLLYDKTSVSTDNSSAWYRCLGQQSVHDATLYMADFQVDQHIAITDGPQTFKTAQSDLELFIPFIFWFNTNVTQSFQMSLMGGLQKFFEVELAPLADIIQAVNANGTINTTALSAVDITSITLYIKNIFVDPVIYDVLTLRKTLTLMRSRRLQVKQLTTPAGEVQLRQIKYPVESLVIGFRPNINADPTNVSSPTRWTQFSIKTRAELPLPTIINNPIVAPAQQLVVRTASYDQSTPVITALSLEAHGNILYPVLRSE